jgi:hypothetical protein
VRISLADRSCIAQESIRRGRCKCCWSDAPTAEKYLKRHLRLSSVGRSCRRQASGEAAASVVILLPQGRIWRGSCEGRQSIAPTAGKYLGGSCECGHSIAPAVLQRRVRQVRAQSSWSLLIHKVSGEAVAKIVSTGLLASLSSGASWVHRAERYQMDWSVKYPALKVSGDFPCRTTRTLVASILKPHSSSGACTLAGMSRGR